MVFTVILRFLLGLLDKSKMQFKLVAAVLVTRSVLRCETPKSVKVGNGLVVIPEG